jgi:hypothetical protein|tara:strand:+ start:3468 stop:3617 length:150 start_codon:yes stop_codon:yes gene_type:complete
MALPKFGVSLYEPGRGKKTSQSSKKRSVKFSSMNKSKKRSWKASRGQGK